MPIVIGTILVINIFQLALILWHATQNNHTKDLRDMTEIAYKKYVPDEKNWVKIDEVTGKISKYKEVVDQRRDVTNYMNIAMLGLPTEVRLQELEYNEAVVSMEFEADSVLSFTKIVSNYLKESAVERIELRSASLNTSDNTFTIKSGVIFR